ncbi:MAG: hypothetical protein Q7K16_03795 [Candidatus Azambacteria bacterium]|nr:hypothetical protein [Candidatus Azambacteria bacterium]
MRIVEDLALVLSGGSYRAMFQIHCLVLLESLGIYPKTIYAISGGVPNALGFMLGKASRLEKTWLGIKPGRLYKRDYWRLLVEPVKRGRWPILGASSIFKTKELDKVIDREVDFKAVLRSPVELQVAVADLISGEILLFSNKTFGMTPEFFRAIVIGSMRIPVFWEPMIVLFEGREYQFVDAGLIVNLPVKKAVEDGFSKIIAIETTPRHLNAISKLETLAEADLRYGEIRHIDETNGHLKWIDFINRDISVAENVEKFLDDARVPADIREQVNKELKNFMFFEKRHVVTCRIAPPATLEVFQKNKKKDYGASTLWSRSELLGAGEAAAELVLMPFLIEQGILIL